MKDVFFKNEKTKKEIRTRWVLLLGLPLKPIHIYGDLETSDSGWRLGGEHRSQTVAYLLLENHSLQQNSYMVSVKQLHTSHFVCLKMFFASIAGLLKWQRFPP